MPPQVKPSGGAFRKCTHCGAVYPSDHRTHRARACPGYSRIWAGDVRVKLFENLKVYGGNVKLMTVTGPGEAGGLSWDEDACRHLGPHTHSGLLGCRVHQAPGEAFNRRAPSWWTALHNEAAQAAHRLTGARPRLLVRIWEMQKRGVLHVHLVVGAGSLQERRSADVYQGELHDRAAKHGFGFVDRKDEVREAMAAAAYLASYFVKGKGKKATLQESVTVKGMPRSIAYVDPRLSRRSGITMRSLRLRRYAWCLWRSDELWQRFAEPVDIWWGLCEGWSLAKIAQEFI